MEISIERDEINADALKEQIIAITGYDVPLRAGRGQVVVVLPDDAPLSLQTRVRAALINHDPAALTAAQRAELERRDKLEAARRDYQGAELDLTAFDKDPLLLALARKIAWLEREITLLRRLTA